MADMETVAAVAGGVIAVGAAVGASVRWLHRRLQGLEEFFTDWFGQPKRPGVPGRPGVMSRLEDLDHRVAGIEHELHPNSGASLRDAVDRIDAQTAPAPPNRKA